MAETPEMSSDAESSCGWTIISNEGSDIEMLVSEAMAEYGTELLDRPLVEEAEKQDTLDSPPGAGCVEERHADSLDVTVEELTTDETLYASKARDNSPGMEHVSLLSSSDHSDIVTLGDLKEGEHGEVEEEAAANEEFYLGMSCSSQYTFTAAETVFSVPQPAVTNSSSSEDEAGRSTNLVIRRRRLRKNTASTVSEPEAEEVLESGPREEEDEGQVEEEMQQAVHAEERPPDVQMQGQGSSILNRCILLAIVVAFSMGFGHYYGTTQVQEIQRSVENVNEPDDMRELLEWGVEEQPFVEKIAICDFGPDYLDEENPMSQLTEVIEKIKKENQELNIKQAHIQAQKDDLEMLLKQKILERNKIMSQKQKLADENQQLKTSLKHEEKSLSTLQEELRNMRSKISDLEAIGAGADSLLSENLRLKDQLEEEKQLMRNLHSQREDLMAEARRVRKKLDEERKVTDDLKRELNRLRSRISGARREASPEAEKLQARLTELEKKLIFEQQRSDLWERLYVETKEERAKGDTESKVKKPKEGVSGKVKATFDAVKNSTKEFVHHHKEQIKKAKEAVKQNLRKFSDSVKSTFQHFKDSASTFINKARGFYNKKCDEKNTKESWQHRHSKKYGSSFESSHNTRKPGDRVHEHRGQSSHKASVKKCSGVFDCAYQEFMALFNKAMEPIRADEFYLLLQSYLQQEVEHFQHWKELEMFINKFFHNGVFIHDKMLFTDFVSSVEDYLTDMHKYHGLEDDSFEDLGDYIYRHFFGEAYTKSDGPSGPFKRPDTNSQESRSKHQQRKQQRTRSRPHGERRWSKSGRNADRHMPDVKIELGPMPFDPKY